MNVLGICAGVGGLELGIRIAEPRARGIAYLEREAYAIANLVARMEGGALHPAPVWSDVATFDARPWRGVVDCVASGDPCQPNSVAGKRLGEDDDRFLLDQVIRIIEECRPARVFRENVPGNADGQLRVIVPALERLGYRVAAGIFSAAEVGASHRRERLFIMADADGWDGTAEREQHRGELGFQPQGDGTGRASLGDVADLDRGRRGLEREPAGQEPVDAHGRCGSTAMGHTQDPERWSEQQAQGARSGRAGPARAGEPLANPSDGQLPQPRRGSEERDGARPAGESMGDTSGRGQRERGDPAQQGRGGHADGASVSLADAYGARGAAGIPAAAGASGREPAVPLDNCGGLEQRLPIFAPGPADPIWRDVLAAAPELEPSLCRMADGLANRVDRLRATGNGVVPLAAAFAWRTLEARLAASCGD